MSAPLDDDALDTLFLAARSYNGWLDMPVSDAELERIWDLARMGPTSANCLPARIVWVKSEAAKASLAECVSPGNRAKVLAAPVTAVIGMDMAFYELLPELFPHDDARSWFAGNDALIEATAFRNSSLQGAYLMLAARAIGLDCGPMSGFDVDQVTAAFFPDSTVRANFICSVGHGDPASIYPRSPRPAFDRFNRIA